MSAVANLHNPRTGRGPAWLWVSPEQFKIDDRLGGGAFDELLEDWCPFLRSWDLVQALEYFVCFYGIAPRFRLASRRLCWCQRAAI